MGNGNGVNLKPDSCQIYSFWNKFLHENKKIATINLNEFPDLNSYILKGLNSTARNVYRKSSRAGVQARVCTWEERNLLLADIDEINSSAPVRQGREMSAGYKEKAKPMTGGYTCPDHYAKFFGAFLEGKLIGYIVGNFCGELSAASQILGHNDYLRTGAMINLWVEFVRFSMENGVKAVTYYLWDSGTEGLRYWKHSVGLRAVELV